MTTNLLLSGGLAHDYPASSAALAEVLAAGEVVSEIRTDIEVALTELADREVDLVTVNACRFAMNEDQQARFGEHHLELGPQARAGLVAHVAAGRPVLAMHAACICFGEWEWWGRLLGARWIWGESWHPPYGDLVAHRASGCPATIDCPETLAITDEFYQGLRYDDPDALEVILEGAGRDGLVPLAWFNRSGEATVLVDLLGHDVESIRNQHHQALIRSGVRSLLAASQGVPAGRDPK